MTMLIFNFFAFLLVLVNAQDDEYVFNASPKAGGGSGCFGPNCVEPYDTVVIPGTTLIKTTVYEPYVGFSCRRASSIKPTIRLSLDIPASWIPSRDWWPFHLDSRRSNW